MSETFCRNIDRIRSLPFVRDNDHQFSSHLAWLFSEGHPECPGMDVLMIESADDHSVAIMDFSCAERTLIAILQWASYLCHLIGIDDRGTDAVNGTRICPPACRSSFRGR
jgi:hypothetical protein